MALMLYLDDAMKVLLRNDFIDIGYIDDDGGSEIVRNELEQKCYLREPVDIVLCKDCKWRSFYCTEATDGTTLYECHHPCADSGPRPWNWFCADGEART